MTASASMTQPLADVEWNGEPAKARKVWVTVADSGSFPTYWARPYVGSRRKAVEVHYGGQVFYIDDEYEAGWAKVLAGGLPRYGHKSLEVEPHGINTRHP